MNDKIQKMMRGDDEFKFEPYSRDYGIGNYSLSDSCLRRAFLSLNDASLYGLRVIGNGGKIIDVGLFDPRREKFQKVCGRFANGSAQLSDFQAFCRGGLGIVVNSPQDPRTEDSNGFNDLARKFIKNMDYPPGGFPETVEVTIFMGSYHEGFGVHRDPMDVAAFVLDGRKHFIIKEAEEQHEFTLTKGQYFRWQSAHWHGTWNPHMDWSMTINFVVGPADYKTDPGTPVSYTYTETKLRDFVEDVKAKKKGLG